ncbi:ATPase family_ AAA domain containing 2B (Silurana), partial [Caligus rogercresseyi]
VYDYLDFIKKPMDFDAMLLKLDKEEYTCAKDYLDDIDLIVENAIVYNSDSNYETNKIICHQAAALRDFSYALVKQEMDTDFEEECQEISERRRKLLEDLKELEASNNNNNNGDNESTSSQQQQQQPKSSDAQHPHHTSGGHSKRRTTSRWSRGELTKKKKKLSSVSLEEEELLGEEEDKALGPGISSTTSPVGGGGPSTTSPHPPPPSQNSPADDLITTGIRIDALKLQERKNELIKITKGFSLERLERVLSKVMNVVDSYATESDRTQLPSDLSLQFDIIKSQRSNHNR